MDEPGKNEKLSVDKSGSEGAYLPASPGDPILAQDWNEMQLSIRKHVTTHTHTGTENQGMRLTGEAIDPGSSLSVKALAAETLTLRQNDATRFTVLEDGTVSIGDGGLLVHSDGKVHARKRGSARPSFDEPSITWSDESKRSILTFDRFLKQPDGAFYEVGNWVDDHFRFRRVWGGGTQEFKYRDDLQFSPVGRVCIRAKPVVVGALDYGPNQRIVAGTISGNGSVVRGEGFSSQQFEEGRYRITFQTPFTESPVVVVTPQGFDEDGNEGGGNVTCYTSAWVARTVPSGFSCVTGMVSGADQHPARRRFSFIAIGALADG